MGNYCIDTTAGQIDCATTIIPAFSSAMSSQGFPWFEALLVVTMTIIYTLN